MTRRKSVAVTAGGVLIAAFAALGLLGNSDGVALDGLTMVILVAALVILLAAGPLFR